MSLEQNRSKEYAYRVGDGVFDYMCVLDSPAVGSLELMMHLVHDLVEQPGVQGSVAPIERHVLNDEE